MSGRMAITSISRAANWRLSRSTSFLRVAMSSFVSSIGGSMP